MTKKELSSSIDDVISRLRVLQELLTSDDPHMQTYAHNKLYDVKDRMEILDNVPLNIEDV